MQKNGSSGATEKQVLEILSEHSARIGELTRTLNKSKETIKSAIHSLQEQGYSIIWDEVAGRYHLKQGIRTTFEAIPKSALYTGKILRKLGMSETHFGGRHSQPHLVAISADFIRSREFGEIHLVAHYGDVFNGLKHPDYGRGENVLNTADLQMEAGIEVLDCLEGVPVFIKPGDHDMWQFTAVGLNMVRKAIDALNSKRQINGQDPNFHYVSSDDGDQAEFRGFVLEFKHITSAQSRGLTTRPQYIFEDRMGDFVKALRGEETEQRHLAQPDHIGFGNWHREITFFHGGTAIDLYPGFQASTTWEKGMGIVHKFGAKIVTLEKDEHGNVFRYDVRYLDFSDVLRIITKDEFGEHLKALALKHFRQHRQDASSKESK